MEKKTFIAYCNCLPVIQSTQYIKKKFVIILERSKEKKLKKKKKMSVYSTLKYFIYKCINVNFFINIIIYFFSKVNIRTKILK